MSILNELKSMAKSTPNDQNLGAKLRGFLGSFKTCCDDENNKKSFSEVDSGPYGWDVSGTKCLECGKIIEIDNIDK